MSELGELKKQNTELQKRVDSLSGAVEQLNARLELRDKSAAPQAPEKKPVTSSLDVEIYGYVKLDAAHDDSRISVGNYARWVESESVNRNDDVFNMTANETRLGLRIKGPQTANFRSSGVTEADFYGGGAENSANPRLRLAYVNFEWPDSGFGVLAGQAKDVISPLYQPRVNFSPGWWQGNPDFRRPQLRLTENLKLAEDTELKLEAAATRTVATAFPGRDSFNDPGADAGFPSAQGRVSLTFPGLAARPTTLGVSGHWGEEEHNFTNIAKRLHIRSWSGHADLSVPLLAWLKLQGEAYVGSDMDAYLGGIGQGVNPVTQEAIDDRGAWAALTLGPWNPWLFNLGYGVDDVDDDDLTASADPARDPRSSNSVYFGNVYYSLNASLQLAFELSYLRTTYKSAEPGDDWREQFAVIYKF